MLIIDQQSHYHYHHLTFSPSIPLLNGRLTLMPPKKLTSWCATNIMFNYIITKKKFIFFPPSLDLILCPFLWLKMVIDFTATWCGPCKYMDPIIQEFAAKYTKVEFIKIDVDELMVLLICFLMLDQHHIIYTDIHTLIAYILL